MDSTADARFATLHLLWKSLYFYLLAVPGNQSRQTINKASFPRQVWQAEPLAPRYPLLGTSNFSVFSCAAITRAISISIDLELTGLAI
jgi:hypothetical protein